jgi:hypothetical protein
MSTPLLDGYGVMMALTVMTAGSRSPWLGHPIRVAGARLAVADA